MPSHQERRAPLPADYQYPTHGVDCDCPPCRNRIVNKALGRGMVGMFDNLSEKYANYRRIVAEPTAETPWGV